MGTECLNLRERFGERFKVTMEESFHAERDRGDVPALQIIQGRRGHVYPWDGTRLAANTSKAGGTAKRLKALPWVEVYTDGSDGVTVLFPVDRLDEVADLLLLRRRRRVSEQERERLAELSKQHGFQSRKHIVGVHSEGLVCVPATGAV
jgi:hypothetical protein